MAAYVVRQVDFDFDPVDSAVFDGVEEGVVATVADIEGEAGGTIPGGKDEDEDEDEDDTVVSLVGELQDSITRRERPTQSGRLIRSTITVTL